MWHRYQRHLPGSTWLGDPRGRFSPVAIQQARKLAKDTPGATFVEGDVSQLSRLGIDGPFDFVLDIGCYHGLPAHARQDYAREVGRVTRPGALFMIWAIASYRWPFLPGAPAMQDKEIAGRFGGSLLGIDPDAPEPALRGRLEAFYRGVRFRPVTEE
jgi:SAM-dependent methyltransferase